MKRILTVVLVALLVLSCVAVASAEGNRKVFFTNAFYTAPFCDPLNTAATAYATEHGIDLTIVDGQGDASVQLDQIKTAIDQGYDGIIYFPADAEGSITIVNTLNESGIPYAIIDSKVDASVVKNGKGKKVLVFKYKPKKCYHKRQGHRQPYTKVTIGKISV